MAPKEQVHNHQNSLDFLILGLILLMILILAGQTIRTKSNFLLPSTHMADQREIQASPELGY